MKTIELIERLVTALHRYGNREVVLDRDGRGQAFTDDVIAEEEKYDVDPDRRPPSLLIT